MKILLVISLFYFRRWQFSAKEHICNKCVQLKMNNLTIYCQKERKVKENKHLIKAVSRYKIGNKIIFSGHNKQSKTMHKCMICVFHF